jgi:hypothetical protein
LKKGDLRGTGYMIQDSVYLRAQMRFGNYAACPRNSFFAVTQPHQLL